MTGVVAVALASAAAGLSARQLASRPVDDWTARLERPDRVAGLKIEIEHLKLIQTFDRPAAGIVEVVEEHARERGERDGRVDARVANRRMIGREQHGGAAERVADRPDGVGVDAAEEEAHGVGVRGRERIDQENSRGC